MDASPQNPLPGSSPDEMFPVLTVEQQRRLLAHGRVQKIVPGETLIELNQQPTKVFVVVVGKLELSRVTAQEEEVFAVCGPGMFTGEINVLTGRRGFARIRAAELGKVIEIPRDDCAHSCKRTVS